MTRVWLAESRGIRMFVNFEHDSVAFGYLNADEGGPYDSYILNFTLDQWNEISELWGKYLKGENLPDAAGYLK